MAKKRRSSTGDQRRPSQSSTVIDEERRRGLLGRGDAVASVVRGAAAYRLDLGQVIAARLRRRCQFVKVRLLHCEDIADF